MGFFSGAAKEIREPWTHHIVSYIQELGTEKEQSQKEKAREPEKTEVTTELDVSSCVFSRILLRKVDTYSNQKIIRRISQAYDLCEILIGDMQTLDKCTSWGISSVRLDLGRERLGIKKGPVSKAVNSGIYFTIDMSQYQNRSTRRAWIENTKDLLRMVSKKAIVLCVGVTGMEREEIVNVFRRFGVKEKITDCFLTRNPRAMLIAAAQKKHAYKGAIIPVHAKESAMKKMAYVCK